MPMPSHRPRAAQLRGCGRARPCAARRGDGPRASRSSRRRRRQLGGRGCSCVYVSGSGACETTKELNEGVPLERSPSAARWRAGSQRGGSGRQSWSLRPASLCVRASPYPRVPVPLTRHVPAGLDLGGPPRPHDRSDHYRSTLAFRPRRHGHGRRQAPQDATRAAPARRELPLLSAVVLWSVARVVGGGDTPGIGLMRWSKRGQACTSLWRSSLSPSCSTCTASVRSRHPECVIPGTDDSLRRPPQTGGRPSSADSSRTPFSGPPRLPLVRRRTTMTSLGSVRGAGRAMGMGRARDQGRTTWTGSARVGR